MRNLTGQRFGRLLVIKDSKERVSSQRHIRWLCHCDCGNFAIVSSPNLMRGKTKSCGCFKKEMLKNFPIGFKHGDTCPETRLHRIWSNMKARCYNPNHKSYHSYGMKKIRVCPEWKDSYLVFKTWALTNRYANHLTIDRIDNEGNYEPSNCQWLTRVENTKKGWEERSG